MFGNVKKFVEKASKKHLGLGGSDDGFIVQGLRPEDVNPRLAFHYGVPSGSSSLAYDSLQHILAIATNDGRIKLFGKDNTQALLQSEAAVPSKFLRFFENQGTLLNITIQNHIEVWDIDKKDLCCVHIFKEEITSLAILQHSFYMFVGDHLGNISVLKFDRELHNLVHMQYKIPFRESHGTTTEVSDDVSVVHIMPQPMAESKRVLIIYRDGLMTLWGISESNVLFRTGGNIQQSTHNEPRKVVSACWACTFGSKVVVGYSNGEIFLWSMPADQKSIAVENKKEPYDASNIPLLKLNLGYKMEKVPIVSLRWVASDGRASRLYVNGFSDVGSFHSFQVIILNENTESRTIKLVLPLTEACLAMEIISCFSERSKHKQNVLALLLKSGRLCLYDDSQIEHYLLQSQSKSPSVPNQLVVKLPFGDSSITAAKLYTCISDPSSTVDEECFLLANKYPYLLSVDTKEKDGSPFPRSNGLAKTKNLYITGHNDGCINFWDASCPLLLLILSIKQQGEDHNSSNGSPVTALHFDVCSQILFSGNHNGLVRIITLKKDQPSSENIFSFLQTKQGSNYTIRSIKLNGAIKTIGVNADSKHLAIGTDKGYVSVVDMEGTTILYQKHFSSQLYTGIISLQFGSCSQNGFEKNALLVGLEDSSVIALEEDTGNALSTTSIHTKKPSRALFMQILDDLDVSFSGASVSDCQDVIKEYSVKDAISKQPLLLVCSEKDVRLYSLGHAIQGIKKLHGKKKLNGTCCAAALIFSPSSEVGLILLFASGKIEIRSLPDLSLLEEASIRGFASSSLKSYTNATGALCASSDGELVVVNGDQEIYYVSVLVRDIFRHLEDISQVYKKNVIIPEESHSSVVNEHKEKKKGILSMVVKDLKGNKAKKSAEIDAENSRASPSEELSAIFATTNFLLDNENGDNPSQHGDVELDIDDIVLEDTKEKPKGRNFAVLNKQLGKKLQAIKGKLKPKMDEKLTSGTSGKQVHEDGKVVGAVDEIKKKYGYTTNESSIPKIEESRLRENVRKLQSIGMQTSVMQDTAQSFSSMAKELLRNVQERKSS